MSSKFTTNCASLALLNGDSTNALARDLRIPTTGDEGWVFFAVAESGPTFRPHKVSDSYVMFSSDGVCRFRRVVWLQKGDVTLKPVIAKPYANIGVGV